MQPASRTLPHPLSLVCDVPQMQATDKLLATVAAMQASGNVHHQAPSTHAHAPFQQNFPPHSTSTSTYHNRQPSSSKRAASPDPNSSQPGHKRNRSFRNQDSSSPNDPLPPCAVCGSIDPHTMPVVECPAEKTWDGKHDTFAKRSNRTLVVKTTGQRICPRWQRREGCFECHTLAHICSGCGSASHGIFRCPRTQKTPSANSL